MTIKEFMALVDRSAEVKMEYTDVTNFSRDRRVWLRNRTDKHRKIIRVPHVDEGADNSFIYPFDNKKEIYNIDIDMIDVGCNEYKGIIFLITNYIKEHK